MTQHISDYLVGKFCVSRDSDLSAGTVVLAVHVGGDSSAPHYVIRHRDGSQSIHSEDQAIDDWVYFDTDQELDAFALQKSEERHV